MTDHDFSLIRHGQVRQGLYDHPIDKINYRDFHLRTPMGDKAGAFRRWFGFNQFQFISAISSELVVGAAIVDTKIATVSFVYIYHPPTGNLHSYPFKALPFGGCARINQTPDRGTWSFRQGKNTLAMGCENNRRTLTVHREDGTTVAMNFSQQDCQPIRLATRVDLHGFAYTQKMAGIPCTGTVTCKSGTFDLQKINACATLDWSAGYLRRRSFWNWICLAGTLDDGRHIGLNGACFTNESSFTENGFWVDGRLHKLAGMVFEYDTSDLYQPWTIYSSDNKVRLNFTPEGGQVEKNNFLVMASNFHQLFGRFSGKFVTDDGETITIDNIYGFTEEHYAKW